MEGNTGGLLNKTVKKAGLKNKTWSYFENLLYEDASKLKSFLSFTSVAEIKAAKSTLHLL